MNTSAHASTDLVTLFKSGSFVDDRGKHLIGKYMMGGAALGGSAALVTSLMNYLAMMKEQGDEATDTSKDDDVLYLTLKNPPAQQPTVPMGRQKRASIGGGLALTGGALATLGSYSLVRHLYQKYKKKQLQAELDDAQRQFLDVVSQEQTANKMASTKYAVVKREGNEWVLYTKDASKVLGRHSNPRKAYAQEYAINKAKEREAEKSAAMNPEGKPMGMTEWLTSTPVALTLLAALSSGALAHRALDRTFPLPKHDKSVGPKRVVLRKEDSYTDSEDELDENGNPKVASYDKVSSSDQFDDGLEFLVHTVLSNTKKANVSELRTIVGAVANGQREHFCHNLLEYGYDTAIDMIKGAEEFYPKDRAAQVLAVGQCVKTAELNPVIGVLAAAEYEDCAPHFMKAAGEQPPATKDLLVKIAGVLGALGRNQVLTSCEISMNKDAAALGAAGAPQVSPQMAEILAQLIAKIQMGQNNRPESINAEDEDPDINLMTTESESSAGAEEGTHTEKQDTKPKVNDLTKKKHSPMEAPVEDNIDQVLVGGGKGLS